MNENEAFQKIDVAIDAFKLKEGFRKGIKVSKDPHSDWLVFNWRQLTWTEQDIGFIIEVYPIFNELEEIKGWNLGGAAYYDSDSKRFCKDKTFAKEVELGFIANQAKKLISKAYKYLRSIKKEEIPIIKYDSDTLNQSFK